MYPAIKYIAIHKATAHTAQYSWLCLSKKSLLVTYIAARVYLLTLDSCNGPGQA